MRIWVARPEPGATRTGARLAALGHAPLVGPVLAVTPTGVRLPAGPVGGRPIAGLLLTSANAVRALHPEDRARLSAGPTFAVGVRTGAVARAAGFSDVRVAEGDAAALARLVRGALPAGGVLVHAAGAERKAEPEASLREAGFAFRVCEVYGTHPMARLPPPVVEALAADGLDGVLHYSRRSAQAAHDLARAAGLGGAFEALAHYCLSADVAVPLVAAGIAVRFVAGQPNEGDLLAGLRADRIVTRVSPRRRP